MGSLYKMTLGSMFETSLLSAARQEYKKQKQEEEELKKDLDIIFEFILNNNTDLSERELDLRERELSLKEKELKLEFKKLEMKSESKNIINGLIYD